MFRHIIIIIIIIIHSKSVCIHFLLLEHHICITIYVHDSKHHDRCDIYNDINAAKKGLRAKIHGSESEIFCKLSEIFDRSILQ